MLDGGLIHVGAVEVGDAAEVGVGRGIGLRGLGDDGGDLLVGAVGEDGEVADRDAVGGDGGAVDPGAVGVEVEVVAGVDGVVDV